MNSTATEEVARSSIFSLIGTGWAGRTSDHQKLVPTFSWIDNCLMVTKMKVSLWLTKKSQMEVSLKVGCLPYAVGKQPSIPMNYRGRKWVLRWWCELYVLIMMFCFKIAVRESSERIWQMAEQRSDDVSTEVVGRNWQGRFHFTMASNCMTLSRWPCHEIVSVTFAFYIWCLL